MIFSIISQQYIFRKTFIADLDFIQNRNNKFLSSIMLLLLSYCSVFKVQIRNFQIKDLKIGGLERTRTSDLTLIRRAL